MYPQTPPREARTASAERWREEISANPALRFLKVVDTNVGEIIALARWSVYESERPESEWKRKFRRDWDEGTNVDAANEYMNALMEKRQKVMGGCPHCCKCEVNAASRRAH